MSNPTLARPPLQRQQTPGLFSQLAMAGWKPGLPAGFPAAYLDTVEDRLWHADCPLCRRSDFRLRPLKRDGACKLVALCPCGFAEEV
jgi:hypothetical protein